MSMDAVLESIDVDAHSGNLDYEGSVQSDVATYENLFGDAGRPIRPPKDRQSPRYWQRLSEVAKIVAHCYQSGQSGKLREAMQTSDFPLLFGDIMDRQMVGRYAELTPDWQMYTKEITVRDFRTVNRFGTDGMEGALNSVGEQKEYPKAVLREARHTIAVAKYGRQTSFSWESMINDDMDALKDTPERFARAARRTEARAVTVLHVGTTGPLAAFYSAGNGNVITGNPPLDVTGLQLAMTILGNMVDTDSEPILVEMMVLEVPPALAIVAKNLLAAMTINAGGFGQVGGGGVAGQGLTVNNWMRDFVKLVVNPYIPIVASSSNGATSWFLHAAKTAGRAPFEAARLRGYEAPQIFQMTPNQTRIGGGGPSPMDGDFFFDTIWYKIRHVFGTASTENTGGAKLSVASNGSGS